jgi:hypothetical protein
VLNIVDDVPGRPVQNDYVDASKAVALDVLA